MKHFFLLGMAMAFLLIYNATSFACSCGRISVADSLATSDAVFIGEVLDIQKNVGSIRRWFYELTLPFKGGTFDHSVYYMSVTFNISKEWKGGAGHSLLVQTPDAKVCCICGYEFEAGKSYLVYASGAPLYTNICTRTKPITEAAPDTAVLDRLTSGKALTEK
jgi:hypothetical protein